MAVISRIRKHSGWLVALIGISIAGFILQDALSGRNQGNRAPKFTVVDGTEITFEAFDAKVNQEINLRRMQGEMQISQENTHQIRQNIWTTMVNDVLLNNACQSLGITVTQKEMNDMFYGMFIHREVAMRFTNPTTGMFEPERVKMMINSFAQLPVEQQKEWHDLEVAVKDDRLKTKYFAMLMSAYHVPSFYSKYLYERDNAAVEVQVASLNYTDVSDEEIEVKDADYKAYLDKNKTLFDRQEESRAIDFVVFDVQPTDQDLAELEEHVNKTYEDFLMEQNLPGFISAESTENFDSIYLKREMFAAPWDSLLFRATEGTYFAPVIRNNRYEMAKLIDVSARPDSLRISNILITHRNSAAIQQPNQRSKEDAKKLADSLRNVLSGTPSMFATVAQTYNEDGNPPEQGGDLGWFLDQTLPDFYKPLNDAAIRGNLGDIMVVETSIGYHVIAITGKTQLIQKAMAAFVYIPIEPSSQTDKTIYAEANKFFAKCSDLDAFTKAAEESKIPVRKAEVAKMDMRVQGLPSARDLVQWAYNVQTEEGQVSADIYRYDNQYVIAVLRKVYPKGRPTVEEIKEIPNVQYAVRNEKKAEILMEKASAALKSNASIAALTSLNAEIDTIDQLTFSSYNLGNKSSEPKVIGAIFGQKDNAVSKPIQGRTGVFVVQPLKRTPATPLEDTAILKQQLLENFRQGVYMNVQRALENSVKIRDNRAVYF